jgi:hypothetical protein
MRDRYLIWEREAFVLLNKVTSDLNALIASTELLLENSAKLTVDRSPEENCKSLSIVHGDIEREVRDIRLSGSNTFVFLGQTYLTQQVNQGNFFKPDDVKSQIQAAIKIPGDVTLKPLLANVTADKICALLAQQNFDDQLAISVEAALDYIRATMLFVFDCVPNADGWALIGARRAFACNGAYLNNEPKRLVETELTSKIVERSDMTFKLPLPLVTPTSLSFTTLGPIVRETFVVMVAVSSGVKGYVNQPGCSLSPDKYSLASGTDLALVFSQEACVTLVSALIEKFQEDPANASLLNSGGCVLVQPEMER